MLPGAALGFAGGLPAVVFTGWRAALAGWGLAFAAGLAAGLAAAVRRVVFTAGLAEALEADCAFGVVPPERAR